MTTARHHRRHRSIAHPPVAKLLADGSVDFQGKTLAPTRVGTWGFPQLSLVLNNWKGTNGTGDYTGDGFVNVSDMLYVINRWGAPLDSGVHPTNVSLSDKGFYDVPSGGDMYISGRTVSGQSRGIDLENDKTIASLNIADCVMESVDYPLYFGRGSNGGLGAPIVSVARSHFKALGGGENNYACRGVTEHWESEGNVYENARGGKACIRVTGVKSGHSVGNTYLGDRAMFGAGPSDERIDQVGIIGTADQPFVFEGDVFKNTSLGVYATCDHVDYVRCDFSECGQIGLWNGCRNIRFIDCLDNGPLQKAAVGLGGIDWALAASRGIEVIQ